uniref:Uncharacterized protein n=1 Tax=Arundo donax TaxID=35708 RepID=A0A0A9H6Q3_ARUDO
MLCTWYSYNWESSA